MGTEKAKVELARALDEVRFNDPLYFDGMISEKTQNGMYARRNKAIVQAIDLALEAGYQAGYTVYQPVEDMVPRERVGYTESGAKTHEVMPPAYEPRFGVVAMIELPTGQVSWCLDSGSLKYNGHSNEDKFASMDEYIGMYVEGDTPKCCDLSTIDLSAYRGDGANDPDNLCGCSKPRVATPREIAHDLDKIVHQAKLEAEKIRPDKELLIKLLWKCCHKAVAIGGILKDEV